MSKYFRWLELPAREDIYTWEGTTDWGNHDLYPIPEKERTYGTLGFFSYYLTSAISVTGFTAASAYVAAGLGAWETVGAIVIGSLLAGGNSFLGGQPGIDKHLGFTMMTRVTFGLRGNRFPLFTSLIGNLIFTGIQAYYGGQAITLVLGAVIPEFQSMPNTLPESAAITTRDLIGFLLYFCLFVPVIYWVPIYKLRKFLYPSIIITAFTLLGILGWAITANGGPGNLVSPPVTLSNVDRAFVFLQAVSSTAAVWGGSGDRLSDWTRYSKSRHASTPALLFGLALSMAPTAVIGVITTSAFYEKYGQLLWTPISMLLYIQDIQYTPACRAGTFFAGVGLLSSQIYINVVQNTVAFGMDIAGVWPKYVSMKRGALLLCVVAISCNPWRFLTQAAVFIEAMNVFSIFSTVTTATLNTDYWLVRRRKWKVPDLYHPKGIYWYQAGFNLRALTAWALAVVPSFPGFIHSMMGTDYILGVDYKMYQMAFFVGYPLAVTFYLIITKIWPPTGLGIQEDLPGMEANEIASHPVIEGVNTDSGSEKVLSALETETDKALKA